MCAIIASMAQHIFNQIIGLIPATILGMLIIVNIGQVVDVSYAFFCGVVVVFISYIIIQFLLAFLTCIFYSFFALFVIMKKDYKKVSAFYKKILLWGYKYICALSRIHINTSGMYMTNEFSKDTKFILVSNHHSFFDTIIETIIFARKFKKSSLAYITENKFFKIPVLRKYIKRNFYHSEKNIEKSSELIKNNISSLAFFMENKNLSNCFELVQSSNCPLVLGITNGSQNIKKNFPWRKTEIYFDIIKVYLPEELKNMTALQIEQMAQKEIKDVLNNPDRLRELRS